MYFGCIELSKTTAQRARYYALDTSNVSCRVETELNGIWAIPVLERLSPPEIARLPPIENYDHKPLSLNQVFQVTRI